MVCIIVPVSCRYCFSSWEIFVAEGRKPYMTDAEKSKEKPVSGTSHTLEIYILAFMWQLSLKLLPYYLLLSLFIWQITYLWWGSVNCFETIHHLSLMLTQSLLICTAPLIHSSNLLLNTYLVAGTLLFGTCHPLSSAPVRICPVRRVSQCVAVLCFTSVCVCVLVQVQAHGCLRLWGLHTSSLWSSRRSATWGN